MIMLDWEKAFDKVNQEKMFQALERLNIPSEIITMIKALYTEPYFRVQQTDQASEWKLQNTGIRQGCPLSPYLFILTMHVLFHDVKQKLNDPWNKRTFEQINFYELLYADDTLLITKSTAMAKKLLHLVEEESEYYDLKLNQKKCNYISYNFNANITFKDGTRMPKISEAVYLGANITLKVDPQVEIRRKISMTMPVLKKLDIFWNKTKCCNAWKIQVLNAVIVSKLIYGLETIEPTEGVANMLNAFHLRGLRKILGMKTTFVDRANTNERVYMGAQNVLRTKNSQKAPSQQKANIWLDRQVRPITEVLKEKKHNLLGHVIRREQSHPLQLVTFDTGRNPSNGVALRVKATRGPRRKGRPRLSWTHENMASAWAHICTRQDAVPANLRNTPYDNNNGAMNDIIANRAMNYETPFQGAKAWCKLALST